MSSGGEVSFPRGKSADIGASVKTKKRKLQQDDLFKTKHENEDGKAKKIRKDGKKKQKTATEDDLDERIAIEELNVQRLPVGCLILGCVEQIKDFELRFSLPGGIQAEVPIANISDTYTEMLERFSADPESSDPPLKPEALFKIGQCLPLKVLEKRVDEHTYKGVCLTKVHVIGTLNPRNLYEEVSPSFLKKHSAGIYLSAAVKSKEDHGYLMDVGIKEVQGFLKCTKPLHLGQLVALYVKSFNGRVLELTTENIRNSDAFPPACLLPGVQVSATVMDVNDKGLEVMVMNEFKGYVHHNHLKSVWGVPSKAYKISQTVIGTILYRNPSTRLVALSLRAMPDSAKANQWWSSIRPGLIVDNATVEGKDAAGNVAFKLPNGAKAYASRSDLSEEFVTGTDMAELEDHFSVGSKHSCRIKSISYIDGFANVTLKKSLLQKADLTIDKIEIGTIVEGKVLQLTPQGLVIDLGYKLQGFVPNIHLVEAATVSHPEKLFPLGKQVKARVTRLQKERHPPVITLTLKKSLLNPKLNIIDYYGNANVGDETDGVVVLVNEHGILVELFNYVKGWVPRNLLSEVVIHDPKKVFQVGQVVHCTVVRKQVQKQKMTLSLVGLKKTEKTKQEVLSEKLKPRDQIDEALGTTQESVKDRPEDVETLEAATKDKRKKERKGKKKKGQSDLSQNECEDSSLSTDKLPSTIKEQQGGGPRLPTAGFDWNDEDDAASDLSDPETKLNGKRIGDKVDLNEDRLERYKDAKEREEHLRHREKMLLDREKPPETTNDFERLVVSTPNSSLSWIHYMSFHLEQGEIEAARSVAERALLTISFREEQEKFNVWVALLNLENSYGTPESLEEVFRRALEKNDQLKVYNHLIKIYMDSEKAELAEQLYKTMVKKFKKEKSVWIDFGLFYMKINQLESARKLMERSFLSLDKRDHVDVISKFAQMEFKYGDIERGKTMFNTLLDQYPKRIDLWQIFIDLIIKYSVSDKTSENITAVRNVFERSILLKLQAKKMQSIFKKYLDFEMKFGNTETVNRVKQKARDYVEGNPLIA